MGKNTDLFSFLTIFFIHHLRSQNMFSKTKSKILFNLRTVYHANLFHSTAGRMSAQNVQRLNAVCKLFHFNDLARTIQLQHVLQINLFFSLTADRKDTLNTYRYSRSVIKVYTSITPAPHIGAVYRICHQVPATLKCRGAALSPIHLYEIE